MVIGLVSDAGEPSSNPVGGCKCIRVHVRMCNCVLYTWMIAYFYRCLCEFFLFHHAYFFVPYSAEGQNDFFPSYPSNEWGYTSSPVANQRSVWRDGGIWIAWAASRVTVGEFPCCMWLSHAKCGGLKMYPSAFHWIGKSTYELWNCAWLLSPGPSG